MDLVEEEVSDLDLEWAEEWEEAEEDLETEVDVEVDLTETGMAVVTGEIVLIKNLYNKCAIPYLSSNNLCIDILYNGLESGVQPTCCKLLTDNVVSVILYVNDQKLHTDGRSKGVIFTLHVTCLCT